MTMTYSAAIDAAINLKTLLRTELLGCRKLKQKRFFFFCIRSVRLWFFFCHLIIRILDLCCDSVSAILFIGYIVVVCKTILMGIQWISLLNSVLDFIIVALTENFFWIATLSFTQSR